MKIEIIPASIPLYSRKNKLRTLTDNAVDLDPDKSKSEQDLKEQNQHTRNQPEQETEIPHPISASIETDFSRVHIVA